VTVPDDFARLADRVADELRRRQRTVHERVACPKCLAPVGERCRHLSVARGWPYGRVLKHPHRERLRADGIAER
jgi:hypothetical protein